MNQFPGFEYRQDNLFVEEVGIPALALEYGTPFYVYSKSALTSRWVELCTAFSSLDFLPCYAVKANSNIAVLQMLAQWGAGFDIVSVGELERVLAAGGDASKIMFSGVAKREDEIRKAIHYQIGCINVESEFELKRICEIAAEMKLHANVSLRINPDVNPNTHPYISTGLKESKFGITSELALRLYASIKDDPWVRPIGVDCHIGSQITETQPYIDAAKHVFEFVEKIEQLGITLKHIDLGGGFGITYDKEQPPKFSQYAEAITPLFEGKNYQLVLEPGRSIIANAGILVTSVEYVKNIEVTEYVLVDAAMNDLIRPALYQAWHTVLPVTLSAKRADKIYDIVGPVCESGDFFAKNREMKELQPRELLAVMSAGAYAMTMASNYNTRQRPCELMVDGDDVHLIRRRDALDELWQNEILLPVD
ncbi:MAG: diaminopimelate decarboxylase [Gammaproteobacteria bacterium]